MELIRGHLQIQEEVRHVSYNEGGIIDHQYNFENYPKTICIYGDELQQFHDENNLILGFVKINGYMESKLYTIHENIKTL